MEDNKKETGLDPEAKTEKIESVTEKLEPTSDFQEPEGATSELPVTEIPTDKQKVAKLETAEKRIEKSLNKQSVEHNEGEVHDALIPLYERYELLGVVPTQEAFAEVCHNQNVGQHVIDMPKDPFRPTGKRNALIAVGCVAAAALIIAGSAFIYTSTHQPAVQPKQESKPAVAEVKQVEDPTIHAKVNCEGWDEETSTPIVLSIYEGDVKDTLTSTDENVTAPDPMAEKQVKAGVDTEITEITEKGTYTLAIVGSPVLEDGTIFNLPDPQVVEYDGEKGTSIELTLNAKPAEEVTEADIVAAQATAVAAGADTEKVTNAVNTANTKAANAQGGTVASGTTNAATKNNANKTGTTAPSGNNSNNNQNNNGNQAGNGGNQSGGEQTHQHSWTPVTQTVHHEAQYKTVHHDAEYKAVHHPAVTKGIIVCKDCGKEDVDADHLDAHILNGGSGSYYTKTITVTKAYDEKVKTADAWDEKVKTADAWDETKITGYKCSCGATKTAN